LTNLHSLSLLYNQLTEIPEHLSRLTNLQSLDLRYNQLTEIPEHLSRLTNLQSLYLSANPLTEIPEHLSRLTNLQSLDLSYNKLTEIPEHLSRLTNLQSLYLISNPLTEIPEHLSRLTNLQSLDLRYNHLRDLPVAIGKLNNLQRLELDGNPLDRLPAELHNKNAQTIINYYKQRLEAETDYLYEAKLLIIGEPGAGKTSLAHKIQDLTYVLKDDEKSTEGIAVQTWNFTLNNGQTFRVNIWDFGGQEIYHATHQFFLTKRSLYALVTDTREQNTDFFYWLSIVELLSENSPLLIIKNEKQERQQDIEERQLRGQFTHLKEILATNLATNRGLPAILDHLRHHIHHLPHIGDPLPKTWIQVRQTLEADPRHYISQDTYFEICRQQGFREKQDMLVLSGYLHDLGVFLHFQDDDLLRKTVILKPTWGTAAVYTVLDNPKVKAQQGHFTKADLSQIWCELQYDEMRHELLHLMMKFKLCYALPHQPDSYIAPQLLPIDQPDYAWDNSQNLTVNYHYTFLPKGILTRLIVEMHKLIKDQTLVWRSGVLLQEGYAQAEVREFYDQRQIRVRVRGTQCHNLLSNIRHELRKIHDSFKTLKYQELISCNCPQCQTNPNPQTFAYDVLLRFLDKRQPTIQCQTSFENVEVQALLNNIGDRTFQERLRKDDRDYDDPQSRQRIVNNIYLNQTVPNTIHQHGQGDNIAGDNIAGDKINTQINNNPDLLEAAKSIKALLDELSEQYNPNTEKGQNLIRDEAIASIETNPTLKTRVINALQSAGDTALEGAIGHPIAKIVIAAAKGFFQTEKS
jgi:small GTP-binding protein